MKKILLSLAFLAFTASATFATTYLKKSKSKVNISQKQLGRECCTRSGTSAMGMEVTVTVCSGWFLSNSERAEARACAAAQAAIDAQQ